MKFVRFFIKEVLQNGLLFVLLGTVILTGLYLVSVQASTSAEQLVPKEAMVEYYEDGSEIQSSEVLEVDGTEVSDSENTDAEIAPVVEAKKENAFVHFFKSLNIGKKDNKSAHSPVEIIGAGLRNTLPLSLLSLIFLVLFTLIGSAYATTSHYEAMNFGKKVNERVEKLLSFLFSVCAAIPLFVGYWIMYSKFDVQEYHPLFIPLVALGTILFGGLTWDALNFLKADMMAQVGQVHGILFSTLGDRNLGRFFPIPGTYSGYLFSSSLPRFLPYLAGKVSAILGSVTIAEVAFARTGIGKFLVEAMAGHDNNVVVLSIFVLLGINAIVSFIVKLVMFLVYPRVYEAA